MDSTKQEDHYKGEMKSLAASEQLQAFEKIPKKNANRSQIFKSLLPLSREAAVYDTEGQISQNVADIIKSDSDLKKSYDEYLKSLPKSPKVESCKNQNLEKRTAEQLCLLTAGVGSQDAGKKEDKKTDKCIQTFDFEACSKDAKK